VAGDANRLVLTQRPRFFHGVGGRDLEERERGLTRKRKGDELCKNGFQRGGRAGRVVTGATRRTNTLTTTERRCSGEEIRGGGGGSILKLHRVPGDWEMRQLLVTRKKITRG